VKEPKSDDVFKLLGVNRNDLEGTPREMTILVESVLTEIEEKGEDYVRANAKFILNRWEAFKGMNLV
jgi:hypothetical protein